MCSSRRELTSLDDKRRHRSRQRTRLFTQTPRRRRHPFHVFDVARECHVHFLDALAEAVHIVALRFAGVIRLGFPYQT